ncbi:DNA-directed RNA polymerase III RPC4, putative [Paecilomyces variotii No. 5]|uniref:DNA-directed RNA polymerase III RPC4, putative n=1 Tax=Byssochlamys spectabilis (strain No. 5 / NBRC 109023) TaxID=1356009 RepID=V5FIY6_BYSSN|nr:DNA-directed RNA polymerase III RPC4, putative [Paecilomyces variotii No. 5]
MPPKAAPRRVPGRRPGAAGESSTEPTQNASASTPEARATPTPGPAGASSRPPVQRLQSLKKGTPSGSIARAQSSGLANDGTQKPVLKYQPRAVGRRSKEEREAMEKLEAERLRERLAEAAAIQRGRGNLTRGRGGARGRGGFLGSDVGGPLGSASGAKRGRGGRFGTDSRASSNSRRSKSVIGGVGGASGAGAGDYSSDESDSGIRVSIDQINLDSDEESDGVEEAKSKGKMPVKGAGRGRDRGLRPIRVERHEHEDRVVSVNLEEGASTSADLRRQAQEKAGDDNALFVEEEGLADGEPQVKKEPTDGDEIMTDAIPRVEEAGEASFISDDGFLPTQKVKVRRKVSIKDKEKEKEKVPTAAKDPRSLLRTREEIEEFERHENDLKAMIDLLAVEEKPSAPEPTVEAPETAEAGEEGADATEKELSTEEQLAKDKHAGQLFLLQFPPMTPNLISRSAEGTEGGEGGEASAETDQPDGSAIKREEDGAEVEEIKVSQEPAKVVTAANQHLRAGRVGKLNLHASGRVTLDWGGISFELDRATEVDFLQEALIVSNASTAATEDEFAEEKRVWAMGQLSGKFVVTPDWEAIL